MTSLIKQFVKFKEILTEPMVVLNRFGLNLNLFVADGTALLHSEPVVDAPLVEHVMATWQPPFLLVDFQDLVAYAALLNEQRVVFNFLLVLIALVHAGCERAQFFVIVEE